jgi:hypothetical protein
MLNRRVAAVIVVLIGCGGGKKTTTTPADPAEEAADCEPGRCLADISARVVDHRAEARECYEEGQKRIPDMQGRIIVNFEIDPDGKVLDASQSAQDEQIMDEQVVRCVEDVVRAITFAKSEKGKTTRAFHRFEFSAP